MTVIDAHLHFWDPTVFSYPWLDGDLAASYLPADLHLGDSGVRAAVFVQADCVPTEALEEVRWASGLGPLIAGIVAYAPVDSRDALPPWLDALDEFPLVRGIRRNLQGESSSFLESPDLIDSLSVLADRGLPFDACVTWRQLPQLAALVARVPDLLIVLDHLGKPPVGAGWKAPESREWDRSIRELARSERVSVKLSGLAPESRPGDDLDASSRPFLEAALDAFGATRCMVGSDWPVSSVVPEKRSYSSWFDTVLSALSPEERTSVGSQTARSIYRLDVEEDTCSRE